MIDLEEVVKRRAVWTMAKEMVDPIVEQHGVETHGIGPANIFQAPPSKSTKVDQHIGHILQVSDWLIDEEED